MNNWATYNQQNNQRITNNQPTDNQQITTTNKDNNINKDNKETVSKDTEQAPNVAIVEKEIKKEYGNDDINKILLLLKNTVGCDDFSESKDWQRKYGKHFLTL